MLLLMLVGLRILELIEVFLLRGEVDLHVGYEPAHDFAEYLPESPTRIASLSSLIIFTSLWCWRSISATLDTQTAVPLNHL